MIHGIWKTHDYRVPAVLFHVIRLGLILSFVNKMEGFKRLPMVTIEAINRQTKSVVLYYAELLIYLINGEDYPVRYTGRAEYKGSWNKHELE